MFALFVILMVIVGYFVVLGIVTSQLESLKGVSTVAVIVLLVYGCAVALFLAVGQFIGEPGLLIYAIAIVYAGLFWMWKVYSTIVDRPRIHLAPLFAFLTYLLAVGYITMFMRTEGSNHRIQMEVFNWLQEDGIEDFNHFLLNVALFVPVGVMYPFVTDGYRGKIVSATSFGVLAAVAIETIQLAMQSGTCDIDDIIGNVIGAFIGALIASVFLDRSRRWD